MRELHSWHLLDWPPLQDGGDPDVKVSPRDLVLTLTAETAEAEGPAAKPAIIAQTDLRCGGVAWG